MWKIVTRSPEETVELGRVLGAVAPAGTLIAVRGEMGAGKTYLAKGIGEGLEVGQCITSPTFNIMNEYMGRLPFYHMDLYRLGNDADLSDLGLDEYFYDRGVVLVEWPELLGEALPSRHIWINMWKCYDYDGNEWRQIELDTIGAPAPWLEEVLTEYAYIIH